MKPKVLIVDDEEHIVELIRFNLEMRGYEVSFAYDGKEGLGKVKEVMPQLILLDLMLPSLDGYKVCAKLREDPSTQDIPIIMLTAKNMEKDKITGLEMGADDYITKPFSVRELIARVKAVMRRYGQAPEKELPSVIEIGDIRIDTRNYEAFKREQRLELTLKEFELLKILAQKRGKVLSRNYLLDKIWGYEYFGETRTVDVHIRHLRKKIEDDDKNPAYIETIRGIGYKIKS